MPIPERLLSIYDPAAGTRGMMSLVKEHLLDRTTSQEEKGCVESFVTVRGREKFPTNHTKAVYRGKSKHLTRIWTNFSLFARTASIQLFTNREPKTITTEHDPLVDLSKFETIDLAVAVGTSVAHDRSHLSAESRMFLRHPTD